MSDIWFTSDSHYSHSRILELGRFQFKTIEEHDATLIANWNSVVKPEDTVWHLGDFSMGGTFLEHFEKLNGKIHICLGNHDHRAFLNKERFASYWDYKQLKIGKYHLTLCHYAMRTFLFSEKEFGFSLHGHSHGHLKEDPTIRSLDVGVDCWNYFPISFEQVKEAMSKKTFKALDHHTENMT